MQGCIFCTTCLFEKLLWLFLPKFFLTSSFPLFFSFWCCVEFWTRLCHFAGLCHGCRFDKLMFWIFWVESFPPFVHYWQGPLLFPFVWGKFLHICGCSVPFFIAFSAVSFFMGSARLFIYQRFSHNQLSWNSAWTFFFPSFPSQAVKCYFIKYCSWTPFTAFLTLLYSIFAMDFLFWGSVWFLWLTYASVSADIGDYCITWCLIFDFILRSWTVYGLDIVITLSL